MTRNNVICMIFLLIMGVFTLYPHSSFAGNCDDESLTKADQKNNERIREAMQKFESAAANFNSAAESYIAKCGEPTDDKGSAEIPSAQIVSRARMADVNYDDEKYWKYTQYYWDKVDTKSEECKNLLKNVKDVKFGNNGFDDCRDEFNQIATQATTISKDLCECNEDQANMLCDGINQSEGAQTTVGCKKFAQYLEEFHACPLCSLFKTILNTIAQISSVTWHAVSEPLTKVVKVFFLVLLALEALKAVSAVGGAKLSSFGKSVLLLCLKAGIAVLLLSNPRYIYGYFLSPVIEGGLEMGVAIAQTGGSGAHIAVSPEDQLSIPSDTFDSSVYDAVISTVREFGQSAAIMPAIGRGLTCYAWNHTTLGLPNVSMWLSGAVFYVLGIMIWLAISFYMIDCTVQIGMLSGLVPLLIACWPFKMTESYAYKGCKMLMNSFFSYVMMGIVLLLGTQISSAALKGEGNDSSTIIEAINNSDIDVLKEACSLGAFQLLILAACAIFAMKLIGQTNDLADQFSKGAGSHIGSKMGGAVMSAATSVAKGAVHTTGRVASSAGKHAAAATGVTAAFNKGTDAIKGGWQKGWAKAGRGVGLGKYQNQQTGSGKEGEESKSEDKENEKPENNEKPEDTPNPETPNNKEE